MVFEQLWFEIGYRLWSESLETSMTRSENGYEF